MLCVWHSVLEYSLGLYKRHHNRTLYLNLTLVHPINTNISSVSRFTRYHLTLQAKSFQEHIRYSKCRFIPHTCDFSIVRYIRIVCTITLQSSPSFTVLIYRFSHQPHPNSPHKLASSIGLIHYDNKTNNASCLSILTSSSQYPAPQNRHEKRGSHLHTLQCIHNIQKQFQIIKRIKTISQLSLSLVYLALSRRTIYYSLSLAGININHATNTHACNQEVDDTRLHDELHRNGKSIDIMMII